MPCRWATFHPNTVFGQTLYMDISIIIVTYNTKEMTAECIESIYQKTLNCSFEVIVIDNASKDGSRQMLSGLNYKNYQYIYNDRNKGFSKANNIASEFATGKRLFFLNSDILFVNDVVLNLMEYVDKNPSTGIIGPKFLNQDGTHQVSCRNFPSILLGFWHFFPFLRIFLSKEANKYYQKKRDYEKKQLVDTVSAGAMMISKQLFYQIGRFDEFSFMYAEDADICRKVRDLDLDVIYYPNAQLIHYGGQSTKLNSYRAIWSYYFAFYNLYKKYYFKNFAFLIKPFFFIRACFAVITLFFKEDKRVTWNNK